MDWRDLFTHLGTPWLAFLSALRGRNASPDLRACPKCTRTSQGALNGLCTLCRHDQTAGGYVHHPESLLPQEKVVSFPTRAAGGAKE